MRKGNEMVTVNDADVEHWFRHGYVIVKDVLSTEEVAAVQANLADYMPTWEEYAARPHRYADLKGGSHRRTTPAGWVTNSFPFTGDALNHATLHPYLLAFVERLVGHGNLALSHAGVVGKYAGPADYDQELHADYSNNTLAFPKADLTVCDIPAILYYSDVTVDLGPTYVVSQELTGDLVMGSRHRSRSDYPELYEAEIPVTVPAGAALIYSMRTFHRGSAMHAKAGARFSQSVAFHTAGPRWLGSATFQVAGGSAEMGHFITHATPREREIVGFPGVGDPYWDDEAIAGVSARYPLMDMAPYEQAR
jgi:ectoine hydroxylase-related dioxygenase (phytanoyl-CoA dioxygenase family)